MTQRSRIDKYHHHDATENPTVVFSRVVLRSIGKQAINEPNRRLNLIKADYMPIIMLNDSYDIDALGIFQNVQKISSKTIRWIKLPPSAPKRRNTLLGPLTLVRV
jgi:hypothetical protein